MRISDWSSDVCSSDLAAFFTTLRRALGLLRGLLGRLLLGRLLGTLRGGLLRRLPGGLLGSLLRRTLLRRLLGGLLLGDLLLGDLLQLGRESCRERVCQYY